MSKPAWSPHTRRVQKKRYEIKAVLTAQPREKTAVSGQENPAEKSGQVRPQILPVRRKEPVRMRSLGPPRSTVFDGRVSDQDGADRQRTVEAAEAGAEASSCDRAQRRRRREGSIQLLQISSRSSSRHEAYIVRNGLPVVYSSESSIVFDRSGKFDGKALPLSWWRRRKVNSIAR